MADLPIDRNNIKENEARKVIESMDRKLQGKGNESGTLRDAVDLYMALIEVAKLAKKLQDETGENVINLVFAYLGKLRL